MKKLIILPVLFFMLAGFTSKQESLDQIIAENKGKVVFIDFWASWCGPCREEMKKLPKFKKKFEGKDIVYVYISMDDNEAAWKKACTAEGISNERYNLMSSQLQRGSEALKGQSINAIPRYMIFNKKGELANGNAPRYGKDLEKELNKYLAE